MCRKPYRAYFGLHECEFFKGKDRPACNAEILVSGADAVYLAPTLIEHYVIVHGYLPPPAFIAAVLASPDEMQPQNADASAGSHVYRKIDKAHDRFLSAVRTLAQVRKLALPTLQLNIGKNKVNVAETRP